VTRTLRSVLIAFTASILVAVGIALATAHPRFCLGTLVGDDAGYYLAIARNYCLGHGFSFDRLRPTNGFNPLMPLLLIPLDRALAPGYDLVSCFRIGALVTWGALALGWWPLHRLAGRVFDAHGFPADARGLAVAAVGFFYAGFVGLKGYYGMDAFLVLLLGLVYLERVSRHGLLARGRLAALGEGALLGAIVLARVDSLPFTAAAFAGMLFASRARPGALAAIAGRLAACVAVVAPYLAWNRIGFGEWLPISARLKTSFPQFDPARSLDIVLRSSLNPVDKLALFVALAASAGWLVVAATRMRRPPIEEPGARQAMGVCALYLVARIVWLLLFSRLDVQGSYFVLAHPFVALSALVLAHRLGGARAASAAAAGVALLTLCLAGAKLAAIGPQVRAIAAGSGDEWALGRRLHDAVSDGDVLYGGALGLIGFAADRPWINGDGVANDRAYQDTIRAGRLAALLEHEGVTHLVVTVSPPRPPGREPLVLRVASTLYGVSDSLIANPEDIVRRDALRRNGGSELWLVRWGRSAGGVDGRALTPAAAVR
jgi:hypothetical protein